MKRLIVCADGTWNIRDQLDDKTGKRRPTNVTKVARAIRPRAANGIDQIVFYHDGVGTGGPLDRVTGGAFGRGIEENIRVLYRFLVYNYEPGDQIYFFGFSRGAFTVRTLAGFMFKVGLLEKDDDYYVPEVYGCYESSFEPGSKEWQHAFRKINNPRPCPPIEFIGVWDTVGALGAPGLLGQAFNKDKYKYHNVGLNAAIRNAYHALAIDERRKPFAPDLWVRPTGWGGQLEQAWFPGVHSDVGGGYAPDGLANEALHWLVEKAEACELEFDAKYLQFFRPCFNSVLHESMSAMYRAMGPHVRPLGEYVAHGESIHKSAIDRLAHFNGAANGGTHYAPANLQTFIASAAATAVYANTTRIARGQPC
jgi:uncharacterized protein (DUF2235 family)